MSDNIRNNHIPKIMAWPPVVGTTQNFSRKTTKNMFFMTQKELFDYYDSIPEYKPEVDKRLKINRYELVEI